MNDEKKVPEKAFDALTQQLPQLSALIELYAGENVNCETLAMQELDHLKTHAYTKKEILECTPVSVVAAVKCVLKQNLSLDPHAGLVYIKTRNVNVGSQQSPNWQKALEIQPSANGLISINRQCGRILDIERPTVEKDATGRVIGVKIKILVPSYGRPRWQENAFDESDFERWRIFSHKENSRNKKDADAATLNYANALYTSWRGGIDPEFARAKAIRHTLSKLGTNTNERAVISVSAPKNVLRIEADLAASEDEYTFSDEPVVPDTNVALSEPIASSIPTAEDLL